MERWLSVSMLKMEVWFDLAGGSSQLTFSTSLFLSSFPFLGFSKTPSLSLPLDLMPLESFVTKELHQDPDVLELKMPEPPLPYQKKKKMEQIQMQELDFLEVLVHRLEEVGFLN